MFKLIDVEFIGLDDIVEDMESFMVVFFELGDFDVEVCKKFFKEFFGVMFEGLVVSIEVFELIVLDVVV